MQTIMTPHRNNTYTISFTDDDIRDALRNKAELLDGNTLDEIGVALMARFDEAFVYSCHDILDQYIRDQMED